ncbi:MAG: hypothetical protein JWP66_16 [Naasia sp.]|nr:hypothetical protein [Naasia sp.]
MSPTPPRFAPALPSRVRVGASTAFRNVPAKPQPRTVAFLRERCGHPSPPPSSGPRAMRQAPAAWHRHQCPSGEPHGAMHRGQREGAPLVRPRAGRAIRISFPLLSVSLAEDGVQQSDGCRDEGASDAQGLVYAVLRLDAAARSARRAVRKWPAPPRHRVAHGGSFPVVAGSGPCTVLGVAFSPVSLPPGPLVVGVGLAVALSWFVGFPNRLEGAAHRPSARRAHRVSAGIGALVLVAAVIPLGLLEVWGGCRSQ